MAQRLVRVICTRCKEPDTPPQEVLDEAGFTPEMIAAANFSRGAGCNFCNLSGYLGRIAVYEIMRVTSGIRELIFANADTATIRELAMKEGMSSLFQDGCQKVIEGITTFDEVWRVAKQTEQDH